MLIAAPLINVHFLGSSLAFMMVYVWGRCNENVRMSFLGLFPFTAPYLPQFDTPKFRVRVFSFVFSTRHVHHCFVLPFFSSGVLEESTYDPAVSRRKKEKFEKTHKNGLVAASSGAGNTMQRRTQRLFGPPSVCNLSGGCCSPSPCFSATRRPRTSSASPSATHTTTSSTYTPSSPISDPGNPDDSSLRRAAGPARPRPRPTPRRHGPSSPSSTT